MATIHKQESSNLNLISLENKKIAIITSEWNNQVTFSMRDAAVATLRKFECKEHNIIAEIVPGAFELPLASQWYASLDEIDGVICIGCVIDGATKHFDYICQASAIGITNVALKLNKPVIYGVLTTLNLEQAQERSGLIKLNGKFENKGVEAAMSMIKLLGLSAKLNKK